MSRRRDYTEESIAQIKRVRAPHKMQTIEEVLEHERKTNPVFLSVLSKAPHPEKEKIVYLIKHVRTENELGTVGTLVEYFAQKNTPAAEELADCVLAEAETTKDRACMGGLFSILKRLLIQHWEVLRLWVHRTVSRESLNIEHQQCFSTVLSEVFKTQSMKTEEILRVLGQAPESARVDVLQGLLADRNRALYFGAAEYTEVFQSISSQDLCRVAQCLPEALKDEKEVEKAVSFLADISSPHARDALSCMFTPPQLLAYAKTLSPERFVCAAERVACACPEQAVSVVRTGTGEQKLGLAAYLVQQVQRTSNTEHLLECAVEEIKSTLPALYSRHQTRTLLTCLSTDKLQPALFSLLGGSSVAASMKSVVGHILRAPTEEDLVSTSISTNGNISACSAGDGDSDSDGAVSVEEVLKLYMDKKKACSFSGLVDLALCEAIKHIPEKEKKEEKKRTEEKEERVKGLLSLVCREMAFTPMLSLIVGKLAVLCGDSKENGEDSKTSGGREPSVLGLLHQHSMLRTVASRDHLSILERILRASASEEEKECLSVYFAAVLHALPYAAQSRIIRDKHGLSLLWSKVVSEYRHYEPFLLASLVGHKSMAQALPNGLSHYTTEGIETLEGEKLFFVLLFALDTQYPLQYLQVLDKAQVFSTCITPEQNAPTKWEVQETPSSSCIEVLYNGTPQEIKLSAEMLDLIKEDRADQGRTSQALPSGAGTASSQSVSLTPSQIVSLLQARTLHCMEKHSLRDVAVHALLGRFVHPKKETVSSMQSLAEKSALSRKVLVTYLWGQAEHKRFSAVLPELEASFKQQHRKDAPEPGPKQKPAKSCSEKPKIVHDTISGTDRVEKTRKAGILAAQITASKKHHTCDILSVIKEMLEPFSEEEQAQVGGHFFSELVRFWKHDREKISKNFDFVITVVAEFSSVPALRVKPVQNILLEYVKCTRKPSEEGYALLGKLVAEVLAQSPEPSARDVEYVSQLLGTDTRVVPTVQSVLEESPLPVQKCVIEEALVSLPEDSVLFLASIKRLCLSAPELPSELRETQKRALEKALALLESRNENTLLGALELLAQAYKEEDVESSQSQTILKGAVRTLLFRTKLDKPGLAALSILHYALFEQEVALPQYEKEELLASLKYDLFYYQHLLLHFVEELPLEELLEVVGKINTPEARSARSAIRKVIVQYPCKDREGIKVLAKLISQTETGSAADRLFVLEIVSETLRKYTQGAWITVFLKLSEALANETDPEIEKALLSLVSQVVAESTHKKQIKELHHTWKSKPALRPLVKKLSTIFTH
ncbi:hypothetical protein NECID01_0050 [Nematocida sp. AWRm77]|nr:hypothetical protein NECID01_0050 [Nematocida sp. AWRm77]